MDIDLPAFLDRLRAATSVLAEPPRGQLAHLREIGVPGLADELALRFDDALAVLPLMWEAGLLSGAAVRALRDVDGVLQRMSGPAGPWSADPLATAPEWDEVRTTARTALGLLPDPPRRITADTPCT